MPPHLNDRGEVCYCGFGKYQKPISRTAAWEPGQWGKGVYYPDMDQVEIWNEADFHPRAEHLGTGPMEHLTIRPDGRVQEQDGAAGDPTALQKALEAVDPRLKVEAFDWSVNPSAANTEPTQDQPSEDEKRYHQVTVRDEFTGTGGT